MHERRSYRPLQASFPKWQHHVGGEESEWRTCLTSRAEQTEEEKRRRILATSVVARKNCGLGMRLGNSRLQLRGSPSSTKQKKCWDVQVHMHFRLAYLDRIPHRTWHILKRNF